MNEKSQNTIPQQFKFWVEESIALFSDTAKAF